MSTYELVVRAVLMLISPDALMPMQLSAPGSSLIHQPTHASYAVWAEGQQMDIWIKFEQHFNNSAH